MRISRFTSITKLNTEDAFILINGITGCVDLVDSNVAQLLQSMKKEVHAKVPKSSVLESLIERGHLVIGDAEEELYRTRRMMENYIKGVTPLHIIVVTYRCNFNCIYCYQKYMKKGETKTFGQELTSEYTDKIYDAITKVDQELRDKTKKPIHLYGGEPLLPENRGVLEEVFSKGHSLNYRFVILTNGFYLQEFVPLLRRYKLDCIQLTLDGKGRIHDIRRPTLKGEGSFEKIIKGIKTAINNHIKTVIRINFDKSNVKEIPEILDYLTKEQILGNPFTDAYLSPTRRQRAICSPVFPSDITSAEFAHLADKRMIELFDKGSSFSNKLFGDQIWTPRFYHCKAFSQLFYDPYGDVYVCLESLRMFEMRVGRYVPTLQFNEKYTQWKNRNVLNLVPCKECPNALICGGGCALNAYLRTGSIMNADCTSFKLPFTQYISYLAERMQARFYC